jgi:c-di-GMP-binding flagellar brake protein YcgR
MDKPSDKDRFLQDRQLPRIRVPKDLDVKVELEISDGRQWAARCLDIHIGGALLEFAPINIPDVHDDCKVFATIQLDHEIATKIPAIVRHFVGGRLGLAFPDLSTQAPGQEDRLSHIVRSVEREVLRKKRQE